VKFNYLKKAVIIAHDTLAVMSAWVLAFWLRYNLGHIPKPVVHTILLTLPVVTTIQVATFFLFGLYRGVWRFASMKDLTRIFKSTLFGSCLAVIILYFTTGFIDLPRSVFPLYAILTVFGLGAGRFLYRWARELQFSRGYRQRVLIVGAGNAGEGLVRDLLRQANQEYYAVGFVDDNVQKRGHDIHGVRVLGHIRDIPRLCRQYRIDLIFIALPSLNAKKMRRVVRWCEKSRLPMRTLPSLTALAKGHVSVNALRRLSIEDLLGREPVNLAFEQIHRELENKHIMVTGGGGSIGSELCRQIAEFRPASLLIVDNSEFNLYAIELELRRTYPNLSITVDLTSVVDTVAMQELFAVHRPQVVFHAAAYKHVPMLESQIRVAVFNNILGTYTVAQLSHSYNVEKFILISTDKAVNPTNIMGATKRAAEVICQSLNDHSSTAFITVRFGNVLGSVGSVVPLFTKQIEQGGPVTVTHPDITRYFMTIPEACQLILQSGANGEGSEIFVLDMGDPIKITYLAQQMIRLAGKEPGIDISIVFTGLRPGEKIFEELFYDTEALVPTVHEKIYKAQCNKVDWIACERRLTAIAKAVSTFQEDELLVLLQEMVPEYKPRNVAGPVVSKEKI